MVTPLEFVNLKYLVGFISCLIPLFVINNEQYVFKTIIQKWLQLILMYFSVPPTLPCQPNPCGSNAQCTPSGDKFVCTCLRGFIGNPYIQCRPECVVSSDCPLTLDCINQKCRDPCPGACGSNAICFVVSHKPQCLCPNRYTGNPYTDCQPIIDHRKITLSYVES